MPVASQPGLGAGEQSPHPGLTDWQDPDGDDLQFRHYAGEVRGRCGSFTRGVDFRLELGDVPLPLALALVTCAFHLERARLHRR